MKLTLRFLGRFSEDMADVALPESFDDNVSIQDLRDHMASLAPDIANRLQSCMIAVNTEYVTGNESLQDGDEVAFLPPVSGG